MVEVLDSSITGYRENDKLCLACDTPLAITLKQPLDSKSTAEINEVLEIFPPSVAVDPGSLKAEYEVFCNWQILFQCLSHLLVTLVPLVTLVNLP